VSKRIVIAVDAIERLLDALALGRLRSLGGAWSADLDLLVTGSRGYGPRAAVLLGSTTHALMRTATCPGLVLPRGLSLDLDG
jgi:nucleotide-binding universal stress UspA family protein